MIFFCNDTATTEIYALSLHDALPISRQSHAREPCLDRGGRPLARAPGAPGPSGEQRERHPRQLRRAVPLLAVRSEEHTSELQSRLHLVCRLLLEKKNNRNSLITS